MYFLDIKIYIILQVILVFFKNVLSVTMKLLYEEDDVKKCDKINGGFLL